MSKRSLRKVRHVKSVSSFKERVRLGQLKANMEPAQFTPEEAKVFESAFQEPPQEVLEHIHGDGCDHDH